MKKLISVALTIIALAMTGCGTPTVDSEMFGEFEGVYTPYSTEYYREALDGFPKEGPLYDEGSDATVSIEISKDHKWHAMIDYEFYDGYWFVADKTGRELDLRIEQEYGEKPVDLGWKFTRTNRGFVFTFTDYQEYNVPVHK